MQIISSRRSLVGRASGGTIARGLISGTLMLGVAALIAYATFGTETISGLVPPGGPMARQLAVGVLSLAFALSAPAAFGVAGLARVGAAVDGLAARRMQLPPALRGQASLPNDYAIAIGIRLPGGGWRIPEIVVGPFGAAVIEELPPEHAVVSRGTRSWDIRRADGAIQSIENPLGLASRDADRVRAWLADNDAEHLVKVHAAVVSDDAGAVRSGACAVIRQDQVPAWLASLPVQRSFGPDRRERVIRRLRAASVGGQTGQPEALGRGGW